MATAWGPEAGWVVLGHLQTDPLHRHKSSMIDQGAQQRDRGRTEATA